MRNNTRPALPASTKPVGKFVNYNEEEKQPAKPVSRPAATKQTINAQAPAKKPFKFSDHLGDTLTAKAPRGKKPVGKFVVY